jgi:hypothetical protein
MALIGLVNENEFYSDHYLAEIFPGDIRYAGYQTPFFRPDREEGYRRRATERRGGR